MKEIGRFVFWLLLPLAVGGASGYVTAGSVSTWYPTIEKPAFNPPDWVFGPVWTTLYLMMGVAAYLALRAARRPGAPAGAGRTAATVFLAQLTLNALWSLLFFGLESPGLALIDIVLLWAAIGLTIRWFAPLSRPAALLLLPYWAWVSFAAALNGSIWWLNR